MRSDHTEIIQWSTTDSLVGTIGGGGGRLLSRSHQNGEPELAKQINFHPII